MKRLALVVVLLVVAGIAVSQTAFARLRPEVIRDTEVGRSRLPALTRPVPGDTTPDDGYSQPDTQIEPSVAVNPSNPRNAVTVFQEGRFADGGDYTNGYATTFDAGKTWQKGELPRLTLNGRQGGRFERASDPVVAFGPHNVVYANSLLIDFTANNGLHSGIAVNVSKDGGRHWSAPVAFQDDNLGGTNDKNWIVVDNSSAPGHHLGRVYVIWDRVAPVVYNYCDANCDQLSGWLPNLQTIPGLVFPGQGIGAYPVVQKDGGLGIVISSVTGGVPESEDETIGGELTYISAPFAGSTPYPLPLVFVPPINIAGANSNGVRAQRASGGLPAAAADPVSGTIYAVWDDGRFRTDTSNDAVITMSTDNGLTWTTPKRVNGGPVNDHVDHYNVAVAVGSGGRVHVMWRQTDEKGPLLSNPVDTYYVESDNGGKTFTRPLRVDRVPSNMAYDAFSRGGAFEGDYNQLASNGAYTYIARCQGEAAYKGEMHALDIDDNNPTQLVLSERGHQHQRTWVAVIRNG